MALHHRLMLSVCFTTCLALQVNTSFAANWLMLQGTEKTTEPAKVKIWGFLQAQYQHDLSKANPTDNKYIPPKLIGPNLTSQAMFNVNRARIGIRGTGTTIDNKINYFLLTEFGNNGITISGSRVKLTDSSLTFNHIPFARVRVGLFKYPGSEEGLQAIHVSNYINFSTVSNQLMLERFPNDDNYIKGIYPTAGTDITKFRGNTEAQLLSASANGFEKPVGAYRDTGFQIFDTITTGDWEHSYAFMMGNGNGLNFGDNNANKTTYYYASSEKILFGKGARRHGIKAYGWYQTGLRAYDSDFSYTKATITDDPANDAYQSSGKTEYVHYKRTRGGLGFKFINNNYRLAAEYMTGTGMIFLGSHKESFDMNQPGLAADGGDGLTGKADGWYIDGGWRVPGYPVELDVRYDAYNRLKGDVMEVNYTTITFGTQYFIDQKTRLA
ncbi:MAG: hypothetical protein OEX07_16420, partial [Gammaproteobacteria bacterium]|nr:hypothetical protein [Gammaproteobacteria bacterium]